ncbi:MAG: hypothetical protein A2Y17_04465 [Clostridiales bacterium GWF2_38_85]|nr:MAG: hypothetical protein A2Y17_04465 [Clostridiales bacterium GWF2_38_85]HBL83394.1 flavodoxin [Clostridiales bacterium]
MKTLIIYSTTYGFTEDCINDLQKQLNGETKAINIMKESGVDLQDFDKVVIGGSIYMGQVQKQLKTFCEQNLDKLKQKKVALFLCCGFVDNFEQNLQNNFPAKLINSAFAKQCFGGELRLDKMKFTHKMITKMMKKMTAKDNKPEPVKISGNIKTLAEAVNKG